MEQKPNGGMPRRNDSVAKSGGLWSGPRESHQFTGSSPSPGENVECVPVAGEGPVYLQGAAEVPLSKALVQKEQQLGSKDFEDRSQQLENLPLLSTDFYSWLMLTDGERLHAAFWDLQSYWNMLEWKRKQLEKEKQQATGQVVHNTLTQSFKHIQFDLRDLMGQVNSQVSTVFLRKSTKCLVRLLAIQHFKEESSMSCKKKNVFLPSLDELHPEIPDKPTSPTVREPVNPESSSKTVWDRRVEGYIILRDLDLYLIKLARDFLLLASKNTTQH
ncbi:LOW QUALITY PROTEIN: uncharacterized protein [Brachionichthys hirsutus]|uniref:LOW QUALITY PROTEIN: uncharacterized protein n=1 Tax=Brachionichthys hirsutus TaxID=412623 RepID=UPI003605365D